MDFQPFVMLAFFVVALLYSSVGHGGASGYLALMTLLAISSTTMRPAALVLNVLVALLASLRFTRAGILRGPSMQKLLLLLLASAIPCAYLGGRIELPRAPLESLLSLFFVVSAILLLIPAPLDRSDAVPRHLSSPATLALGGILGLLAGMTGIGGGVLLSPVLVLGGICAPRVASGLAALFIVCNSLAGLLALAHQAKLQLPPLFGFWLTAVALGGVIGSGLGVHRFNPLWIKRILAGVLLLASTRLVIQMID